MDKADLGVCAMETFGMLFREVTVKGSRWRFEVQSPSFVLPDDLKVDQDLFQVKLPRVRFMGLQLASEHPLIFELDQLEQSLFRLVQEKTSLPVSLVSIIRPRDDGTTVVYLAGPMSHAPVIASSVRVSLQMAVLRSDAASFRLYLELGCL